MIYYKTEEEITLIRLSGDLLGKAHGEIAKLVEPGIRTMDLDKRAYEYITDLGGWPSFKNFNNYPYSLCISVNESIVHGMPSDYVLKEGDIVSIDGGVLLNGFHSDSAFTYGVGEISSENAKLLSVTKESLEKAISATCLGNRIGDIGYTIQQHVEKEGYSVVRELVGHGIGKNLHEKPEVPNYGKRGHGLKLQDGIVLAIEPMVNLGKKTIVYERDGWTVRTADRKPSAHFEHTVAIHNNKTEVLTTFKYIEEILSSKCPNNHQ